MRKLATIRKIEEIKSIPEADKICAYRVGGWWVVDSVGKYTVDDLVVFCEVDSWMPTELAPFLTKGKEPREFEGVKGERLRTVKLRGQLSQGLLIPIPEDTIKGAGILVADGLDVTDHFGIKKWERPMNAQIAGLVRGNFPGLIPKTDQERCQNIKKEIQAAIDADLRFEVTEKLEGSSCTMYLDQEGEFHVCSRNMDLKMDENNAFWKAAIKYNVEQKLRDANLQGVAIQGELIGPGIQGNIYKLSDIDFFVFDVYSVIGGGYLDPHDRRDLVATLGLKHVPVYDTQRALVPVDQLLGWADGNSVLGDATGPLREGLVFKQANGGMSFKAISNKYLLGEK